MGYDIHITRARYWFEEDEDFVTLDDVIAVWDKLDKGFSIDRNGVVYSALRSCSRTQPLITG